MVLLKLFSKKWIVFTLIVIAVMALFVRLGFWQLDRYEQKRAYNALLAQRWAQEPFNLSREPLPADLKEMEYRRVTADGYFDYDHQIVLRGQVYRDAAGVVLVTPFVMDGNRAVLVARGWVPADRADPRFWPELEEPAGAPMIGLIRPSQAAPNGQISVAADSAQREWYRIDIAAIQAQMPYSLEPVWIQQLPEPARPIDRLPVREEPMALDATTHMSYAVQWFSFAVIAGFGYVMFVRFKERQARLGERSADVFPLSAHARDVNEHRVAEQVTKADDGVVEASASAAPSKAA
ncbi:SURF1 family protein [Caldilinea sp.]|jgi:surfeit locus 1 family protein|uniref:SURF1 family protein n=1 Tax=Caldilinea sp. TaxID=2293560 RepID=UPI002622ADAC|nr:SURF1 family protein [uncultured Caldilinea sp.]